MEHLVRPDEHADVLNAECFIAAKNGSWCEVHIG